MLKKIAKVVLVVAAALFLIILIFGIVLVLNWPWWTGFFVLLGFIGLAIGVVFLKKVWLRSREQKFVNQIIAQDDQHIRSMVEKERDKSRELQDRFKEAIETLRHSHLKKQGNPMYVLPWYLVIGESGTGKTTAIKSARLSSTFAEITKVSGISGTRNCDWWFFDHAIIIDTAGRYAIPIDEGRDKEEWREFLPFLAKYRKKEPLNGLIVTIAADKLLSSAQEILEEDGRLIRSRIDELMLALGAKFPVYILVTKCDLIQGMTQFCDKLPEEVLAQAMGHVNHEGSEDVTGLLGKTFAAIDEQLRNLRLLLLHETKAKFADPALILFPDEFIKLQPGLAAFMKTAFHKNPYQETPLLRGLFFSSGRQEGTPYSHFLKALGLIEEKEVLPGTSKGLFLHDFFARILPSDRTIFAPTRRALEWNRLTRNLGLTSWVAIIIALCGLMSFSFVKNLKMLREVPAEFLKNPVLHGEIHTDVAIMSRFQQAALRVEQGNRNWWIPRFGLEESKEVETELKKRFTSQFRQSVLAPHDKDLAARMANISAVTPADTFGMYITHLVRRINLLRTFLGSHDLEEVKGLPPVPYKVLISPDTEEMVSETKIKFADLYLTSLLWSTDTTPINTELNGLQKWLVHILSVKDNSLDWLVPWANEQPGLSPITLDEFWFGSNPGQADIIVQPAFTAAGRKRIHSFLQELEAALPEPGPPLIARQKIDFETSYKKSYFDAWLQFASGFSAGSKKQKGVEEWRQMAQQMAKDDNPYFKLLDTMAEEFSSFADSEHLPSWIGQVLQHQQTKKQAALLTASQSGSLLGKAAQKSQTLLGKMEQKLGKDEGVGENLEQKMKAGEAYLDYRNALLELMPVVASRRSAFEAASALFNEDPAVSKEPFFAGHRAVDKVKTYLATAKPTEEVFWNLLNGPLDYLADFVCSEAACHLQDLWDKDVLTEIQGVSDQRTIQQILFDQDGYAVKYINGPAAPFLSRSRQRGYFTREVLNKKIAFAPSFLSFMTKGSISKVTVQANYNVTLEALPTDVNRRAQLRPHATHFIMQCATDTLRLDNFQFPVRKTFKWSPEACGDITFQIDVGEYVLTRHYTGYFSLAKFLNDFRTGAKVFHADDFPEEKTALQRLGIDNITVKYKLGGQYREVLGLLQAGLGTVPAHIASCWAQ